MELLEQVPGWCRELLLLYSGMQMEQLGKGGCDGFSRRIPGISGSGHRVDNERVCLPYYAAASRSIASANRWYFSCTPAPVSSRSICSNSFASSFCRSGGIIRAASGKRNSFSRRMCWRSKAMYSSALRVKSAWAEESPRSIARVAFSAVPPLVFGCAVVVNEMFKEATRVRKCIGSAIVVLLVLPIFWNVVMTLRPYG